MTEILDLLIQLSERSNDRKTAGEVLGIQRLILQLQTEQTTLHERNFELLAERAKLKALVVELQERVAQLEKVDAEAKHLRTELATLRKFLPGIGDETMCG